MRRPLDSPLSTSLGNLNSALIKLEQRSYEIPDAGIPWSVVQPQNMNNISLRSAIADKFGSDPHHTEKANDTGSASAHNRGVQLGADRFSASDESKSHSNETTINVQESLPLVSGDLERGPKDVNSFNSAPADIEKKKKNSLPSRMHLVIKRIGRIFAVGTNDH